MMMESVLCGLRRRTSGDLDRVLKGSQGEKEDVGIR